MTGPAGVNDAAGGRRFRFGVIARDLHTAARLAAGARRAEELGYSTLLMRDHLSAGSLGRSLAPLTALMAAACATRRLRVGTLVLDNDHRHPAVLAKEAATLDVLSEGRFELGLGAGWMRSEYAEAGIPFDRAGVRVERLEEAIAVLRGLLSGDRTSFAGRHYTIDGLRNFPCPVQRPRPPLLVGAGSPRMLALAGREADIVAIAAPALADGTLSNDPRERSADGVARKVARVREAAGGRFADIELCLPATVHLVTDRRVAAERLAAERGWGASATDLVLDMPSLFFGTEEDVAEQMRERRDRYGISYYVVPDQDMEAFAPIVELLAGR
ncbi:TIGR03621 family F420-dependent LLM class oxidoreductase [Actinomadura fulvescens]|uniref:LLM class F420-dependent oxidoreductase n=1 Tax=Actinomadura fulvescens TaxID=46160 RepID=A0ABP6CF40_9ACTN